MFGVTNGPLYEGLAYYRDGDRFGFRDAEGRIAIPARFEEAANFHEGRALAKVGGLYGYIDAAGREVVPPSYVHASHFSAGRALVMLPDRRAFVIDREGALADARASEARWAKGTPMGLVDGVPVAIPECCQTRPWGIDLETGWEVGRLALRGKRWSILCFTDGVTESPAQGQRSFGAHRVTEFHRNNFKLSAEDLCQGLLNDVAAAYGRDTLADDQTVLVLCSS